jgi:hypothetical protein
LKNYWQTLAQKMLHSKSEHLRSKKGEAMNRLKFNLVVVFIALISVLSANAQWNQNTNETKDTLKRLTYQLKNFRDAVNSRQINRTDKNEFETYYQTLQGKLGDFQNKVDDRNDSSNDLNVVLEEAGKIDAFVNRIQMGSKVDNEWSKSKTLFDQLASGYGIAWAWEGENNSFPADNDAQVVDNQNNFPSNQPNQNYPTNRNTNTYSGLSGTYQFDSSRSENARDEIEKAIQNLSDDERNRVRAELENRLESPDKMAIEVNNKMVTLASTKAPQATFTADGSVKNERLSSGDNVKIRANMRGDDLTISTIGDNDFDYTITFSPSNQGIKVTRRLTTEYLSQTIFIESYYQKLSDYAQLDIFDNPNGSPNNYPTNNYPTKNYPPTTTNARRGNFIIPSGTMITGTLTNDISTKVSQNGDRFRLQVTSPNQYRGAVIEGYVSNLDRSNRNPVGKSQITFNFETIRLVNGQTYDFAGFVQSITDAKGKTVKVNDEGTAQKSQTKETIKRGGIGAGAGAIIGAIVGGAKGAIIGAVIGAGGGAGTVAIQNDGDLELLQGSAMMIQASSPNN